MQKFMAAALAVPILVVVYAGSLVRRAGPRQVPVAIVAFGMSVILVAGAVQPRATTGTLTTRQTSLAPTEFTTEILTGGSPSAPIMINFPAAMNPASVEQQIHIVPATAVTFSWDSTDTLLTIAPRSAWAPGTFHTVTVEAGALDSTGRPTDSRIRSAFLTREAVTASIVATGTVGETATPASRFRITFSGPVNTGSIALQFTPKVAGQLVPAAGSTADAPILEFIPAASLAAGVTYEVALDAGARDADGATIAAVSASIRTASAPAVVRFRPTAGSTRVGWSQNLSVRFTEAMDRASAEAAWSAVQAGKTLAGKFTWAENDTVLVFNPTAVLGYSQKVVVTIGSGATSRAGLAVEVPAAATFTTAARPTTTTPTGGGSGGGSGGSIGGSTWAAVEAYYLKLMNCTRTGGIVTSTGGCSSPGGRNVAALWQDAGITAKVSRPYARKLAVNNLCTHFSGGNPGDRLRAAGYTSYVWAENLGCRTGDPYAAVLGSHRYFQAESSYNGGHYVNLMNAKYDRVGIGVWVSGSRVRLVVDFYHPL